MPFYLENLELPYTAPQLTADEIYAQLLPELEDIIASNVLPMRWPATESGRVSQAMAYMLYAEMVMYQKDTQRYAQALSFMKEIINSSDYELNPDYAALWEESGEWCKESIFEVNYDDNAAQRDWGTSMFAGGSVLPTLISPNTWPGGDGWNAGEDGWGFLPMRVETKEMFPEGDVRRDATVWDVSEYSYTERYQDTHLWLKKYRPYSDNNKDCPTSKNLNYNKEFCGEGKRYFDLVRTGYAATTLVPDKYGYRTNSWTESKKHIPLAQSELDADPTLKQNNY